MEQKTFNRITIVFVFLSLIISAIALFFSWSQYSADYDKSVLVKPGTLPLVTISEGKNAINLEVTNTSKTNLQYFIKVRTNIGFLDDVGGKPQYFPFSYESQLISLSKPSAGKNTYMHTVNLDAQDGSFNTSPLVYMSAVKYYFHVSVIDAGNGRNLYDSKCFYGFHREARKFVLDQPIIDTSGESDIRQKRCRA